MRIETRICKYVTCSRLPTVNRQVRCAGRCYSEQQKCCHRHTVHRECQYRLTPSRLYIGLLLCIIMLFWQTELSSMSNDAPQQTVFSFFIISLQKHLERCRPWISRISSFVNMTMNQYEPMSKQNIDAARILSHE